jgi:hypothetical protein
VRSPFDESQNREIIIKLEFKSDPWSLAEHSVDFIIEVLEQFSLVTGITLTKLIHFSVFIMRELVGHPIIIKSFLI